MRTITRIVMRRWIMEPPRKRMPKRMRKKIETGMTTATFASVEKKGVRTSFFAAKGARTLLT